MGQPGGHSRDSSDGGDLPSEGRRGQETRVERDGAPPEEPADGGYPVSREECRRPPERRFPEGPEPNLQPVPRRTGPFQFSLSELLLLFVLSAVALGSFQLLPPQQAAGLAGLIALVSLVVLLMIPTPRPSLFLAWWMILAIYVATAAVAVFRAP